MWTAEKIYEILRYHIPSRIYYNKDYYPIIMAMAQLVANTWNNADKLPDLISAENAPENFIGNLFEMVGYNKKRYSNYELNNRVFLNNFIDILKHRGTDQAIVSVVQFDGDFNDDTFTKFYTPEVKVEPHPTSGNAWEYMVYYPMDKMQFDPIRKTAVMSGESLYKYVKPAGQKDYVTPVGYENYWANFYVRSGVLKGKADFDYEFFPNMIRQDIYDTPYEDVDMSFYKPSNIEEYLGANDSLLGLPKYLYSDEVKKDIKDIFNAISVVATDTYNAKNDEFSMGLKSIVEDSYSVPQVDSLMPMVLGGYKELYPRKLDTGEYKEYIEKYEVYDEYSGLPSIRYRNVRKRVYEERDKDLYIEVYMDMGEDSYAYIKQTLDDDRFNQMRSNVRVSGNKEIKRVQDYLMSIDA